MARPLICVPILKRSPLCGMERVAFETATDLPSDSVSIFLISDNYVFSDACSPKQISLAYRNHNQSYVCQSQAADWSVFSALAKFLTPTVLIKLYKVLIRPHLKYCPYVWDPFTIKLKQQIESVQKFALQVCLKHWDVPYSDMLELTGLPILESRPSLLYLCLTFKIVHGLVYFPLSPLHVLPHVCHTLFLFILIPTLPLNFITHAFLILFLSGIHYTY